jgi:hypothetical protein
LNWVAELVGFGMRTLCFAVAVAVAVADDRFVHDLVILQLWQLGAESGQNSLRAI